MLEWHALQSSPILGVATAAPAREVTAITQRVVRMERVKDAPPRLEQGKAATSALPMGSLYEGALFMLFEMMILQLGKMMDVPADEMRARHTTME